VYSCRDPVTTSRTYFGSHVNHAARIEPVTPPGAIYASEHFAALSAFEGVADFTFEYAGQIPLPKDFGVYPLYSLKTARP
jgi:class 3 adenylate cyclase